MCHFSRFTSRSKFGLLLAFVASFLALSSLASPAFAASTGRNSQPSKNTWKVVSSPGKGGLQGIAAISANDVWAVGSRGLSTLTEHWNGSAWKIVASPNPQSNNNLISVSAVSTSNVWAVGWKYFPNTATFAPLIEHWNGSAWKIVASPNPNSNSYLNGVAVVSASDIWAVGNTVTQQGQQTLIEQWNGSTWSVVSSPGSGNLNGVAVVSANDIWAVGETSSGMTLIEQWNGTAWTVVSSPHPGSSSGLSSVSVVSASDIWAVGSKTIHKGQTLTEHWNGTAWKVVTSPNVPSGPTGEGFDAVAVVSTSNVWAVGFYGTGNANSSPLIEHWNGTNWKVVTSPSQGDSNALDGVASVPGGKNLWAVGYTALGSGPDYTFIEYYG